MFAWNIYAYISQNVRAQNHGACMSKRRFKLQETFYCKWKAVNHKIGGSGLFLEKYEQPVQILEHFSSEHYA